MKCFASQSSTPLNGIRLGFASQVATTDIDPNLPQMNVSDYEGCYGIFVIYIFVILPCLAICN